MHWHMGTIDKITHIVSLLIPQECKITHLGLQFEAIEIEGYGKPF